MDHLLEMFSWLPHWAGIHNPMTMKHTNLAAQPMAFAVLVGHTVMSSRLIET